MKKLLTLLVASGALIGTATIATACNNNTALTQEVQDRDDKIEELEKTIQELQSEITALENSKGQALDRIAALTLEKQALEARLEENAGYTEAIKNALFRLDAELKEKKLEVKRIEEQMKTLQDSYVFGIKKDKLNYVIDLERQLNIITHLKLAVEAEMIVSYDLAAAGIDWNEEFAINFKGVSFNWGHRNVLVTYTETHMYVGKNTIMKDFNNELGVEDFAADYENNISMDDFVWESILTLKAWQ